jgi:hypothetical protein
LCMHIKGNNYQDEDTSYRMGEKSFKFWSEKGLISRMY